MRLAVVLVILFAGAAGEQCARGETRSEGGPPFMTSLRLEDAAGKQSSEFGRGEPITLVITVRNQTSQHQLLTLSTTQTYDCIISTAAGAEIWRWSRGRMFGQVLTEMPFSPGQERRFEQIWHQVRNDGASAAPGLYQAVGAIPSPGPGLSSGPVRFSIR